MCDGIQCCDFILKSERFVKVTCSTGKCVRPYELNHFSVITEEQSITAGI